MKRFLVLLLCLGLCGCATIIEQTNAGFNKRIKIGMTEKQVYDIEGGNPSTWSRKVIDGKTYETWAYSGTPVFLTFDFVDGILTCLLYTSPSPRDS